MKRIHTTSASSSLRAAPAGIPVRVRDVRTGGALRRRLMDIGLTEGAQVAPLYEAPSGNPRAYLIRGAVIALRDEDAETIRVEPIKEAKPIWD